MRGDQELDVVHKIRIHVFVIPLPLIVRPCVLTETEVSAVDADIRRTPSTAEPVQPAIIAHVHHVSYSHKSTSSGSFQKDVYVLVWSGFHYLLFIRIKTQFKGEPDHPPARLL